jgi:hypothetical protein
MQFFKLIITAVLSTVVAAQLDGIGDIVEEGSYVGVCVTSEKFLLHRSKKIASLQYPESIGADFSCVD